MTPQIPWLGVLLALWLMYRTWKRRSSPVQPLVSLTPASQRAFTIWKRARAAFLLFGAMGVVPYVWDYPERIWLPPLIAAAIAFVVFVGANITLANGGLDPRRLS